MGEQDQWAEIARLSRMDSRGVFPIYTITKYSGGWTEQSYQYQGLLGAITFNVSAPSRDEDERYHNENEGRMGGVEFHWRAPVEDYFGVEPHHKNCDALGGACWHDGTSLWASEYWIPRWLMCSESERSDEMFAMLAAAYRERFEGEQSTWAEGIDDRRATPSKATD